MLVSREISLLKNAIVFQKFHLKRQVIAQSTNYTPKCVVLCKHAQLIYQLSTHHSFYGLLGTLVGNVHISTLF